MTTLERHDLPVAARHDNPAPDLARLLLLDAEADYRTALDGAWWPRSTSLAAELPALMAAFGRQGVQLIRVAYHRELWEPAQRKLQVGDRSLRLGWFRAMDRHGVSLGGRKGERIELLVVPPATLPAVAERAMALAVTSGNRLPPTAILAAAQDAGAQNDAASIPAPRPAAPSGSRVEPAFRDTSDWDSEGGAGPWAVNLRRPAQRARR